jgi:hypothetical protein
MSVPSFFRPQIFSKLSFFWKKRRFRLSSGWPDATGFAVDADGNRAEAVETLWGRGDSFCRHFGVASIV